MRFFLSLILLTGLASSLSAQSVPTNGQFYDWSSANTAGVVGNYLSLVPDPPAFFTIDAVTTGTAPTSCTFEVESSPDGVNWNAGSGSLSGSLDCHTDGVLTTHFQAKPVRFIRINVTAITGGDGTTSVKFSYTRGTSNAR